MTLTLPTRALTPVQASFARRAQGLVSRITPDRRRHKRVALTLLGRFMRENRQEYPCKLAEISVGGATIMSPVDTAMDERVVCYFDHIGGLEGNVMRRFEGGFAMRLIATQHKREKLAAQLTFLINRPYLGELAERQHERMRPKNTTQSLTLTEGLTVTCQIIDFSLSGASIATPARPTLGTEVKLGNVRCEVMRHHPEGIAVKFIEVQHANALRRYFG